jgi:hypothetical protein
LSEIVITPVQEDWLRGEETLRRVVWARDVLLRDHGVDVADRETRYPWGAVYNYAGGRLRMTPMGACHGILYGSATTWDGA